MTAEWFLSIMANFVLFAFLCAFRPKKMGYLWIYQTFIVAMSIFNVIGWYRMEPHLYDEIWRYTHILQICAEAFLWLWLLRRTELLTMAHWPEAGAFFAILIRLHLELESQWAWDDTAFTAALKTLRIAHIINPVAIALLCCMVYAHRQRNWRFWRKRMTLTGTLDPILDAELIEVLKSKGFTEASAASTNSDPGDGDDDGSLPHGGGGH